jgi:hypothetical protein
MRSMRDPTRPLRMFATDPFRRPTGPDGAAMLEDGKYSINGRFTVGGFTGALVNPPPPCMY